MPVLRTNIDDFKKIRLFEMAAVNEAGSPDAVK